MDDGTDTDEFEERTGSRERRADRITELERELDRREARIQELERQLSEARGLEQLAERLCRGILEHAAAVDEPGDPSQVDADDVPAEETDEILLDRLDEDADSTAADDEPVMTAADALGGDGFTLDTVPEPDPAGAGDRSPPQAGEPATESRTVHDSGGVTDDDRSTLDTDAASTRDATPTDGDLVARLSAEIESLSVVEREMLRHYRDHGPTAPQDAHAGVGGSGDRTEAYAANRALRRLGVVEHAARGKHRYALPALLAEAATDPLSPDDGPAEAELDRLVQAVEASFVHDVLPPSAEPDAETSGVGDFGDTDGVGAWPDA